MKKVLILLALALFSCSTDEEAKETPTTYNYQLTLEEVCLSGSGNTYEVTEFMYKNIYNSHKINDCEEYHRLLDVNEDWREGYLSGMETNDPKYQ